MYYKVKISLRCPYDTASAVMFVTVPQSDMHMLFSTLPLPYSVFRTWCSPRTAARYRHLFSDDDFALYTTLSCTLVPRA